MKEINIKLDGMQAGLILGAVLTEAFVTISALRKWRKAEKRAEEAETKAWIQGLTMTLQDIQIKSLQREIDESKAKS